MWIDGGARKTRQETNLQWNDLIQTKKGKRKKEKLSKRRGLNVSWPCRQGGESEQRAKVSKREGPLLVAPTRSGHKVQLLGWLTDRRCTERNNLTKLLRSKVEISPAKKGPTHSPNAHTRGRLRQEDDHNVGPSGCIKIFFFFQQYFYWIFSNFPAFWLSMFLAKLHSCCIAPSFSFTFLICLTQTVQRTFTMFCFMIRNADVFTMRPVMD